jgi:hypothetical protein
MSDSLAAIRERLQMNPYLVHTAGELGDDTLHFRSMSDSLAAIRECLQMIPYLVYTTGELGDDTLHLLEQVWLFDSDQRVLADDPLSCAYCW